jgi:hypothetical protein
MPNDSEHQPKVLLLSTAFLPANRFSNQPYLIFGKENNESHYKVHYKICEIAKRGFTFTYQHHAQLNFLELKFNLLKQSTKVLFEYMQEINLHGFCQHRELIYLDI